MQGNGKVKDFYGNYTEYKIKLQQEERVHRAQQKLKKTVPQKQSTSSNTGKPTYKEQKEFELLESEIERLEKEKSHYLELLNAGNGTPDELTIYAQKYADTDKELDIKTNRWIELSDKMEQT
jgi:ATP-binding cassette subfamily F protein uup